MSGALRVFSSSARPHAIGASSSLKATVHIMTERSSYGDYRTWQSHDHIQIVLILTGICQRLAQIPNSHLFRVKVQFLMGVLRLRVLGDFLSLFFSILRLWVMMKNC